MKLWKIGLAGLSEVASSESILARDDRARAELSPEELKDRLRDRLVAGAVVAEPADWGSAAAGTVPRRRT